jgi:hypothetical protein
VVWASPCRGLTACEAEWELLYDAHNLLKLWRTTTTTATHPLTGTNH